MINFTRRTLLHRQDSYGSIGLVRMGEYAKSTGLVDDGAYAMVVIGPGILYRYLLVACVGSLRSCCSRASSRVFSARRCCWYVLSAILPAACCSSKRTMLWSKRCLLVLSSCSRATGSGCSVPCKPR